MENYNLVPAVCIVGRPNVGKSSLFNALSGRRHVVVVAQPGTTRDRVETIMPIAEHRVKLVDTGGYVQRDEDELAGEVKKQTLIAVEEAAIIIMVTDSIHGIDPLDREVASILRKFNKPIIVAANKTDNEKLENDALEFYQLGLGEPESVSCLHRKGIRALANRLGEELKNYLKRFGQKMRGAEGGAVSQFSIAVVGRPNTGKSSFVNNLLARDRVIVSHLPGTTRDSIDTYFTYKNNVYVLIDTAGIRHKRKVKTRLDAYSVMRSEEAIERADVAFLLIESASGLTRDDLGILDLIEENGKGCLILVNKWDLAESAGGVSADLYKQELIRRTPRLNKFPIAFISAKTGKGVLDTLAKGEILNTNLDVKVSTAFLNKIFKKNDPTKLPIPRSKKRPNFLYICQSGSRPVEFKFFVNDPACVLPAHISFIENRLRANLPLSGISVKIKIRRSRKQKYS